MKMSISKITIIALILLATIIFFPKISVFLPIISSGLVAAEYIEPPDYHYVRIPISFVTEEFLTRTNFNLGEVQSENWIFGYLPHKASLTAAEEKVIEILDEDLLSHNLFDRETLEIIPTQEKPSVTIETTNLNVQDGYHTYEDLYFQMKTWSNQNPKMQLYSAGDAWMNINCPDADHPKVGSNCRRQLWFMRISANPGVTTHKPRIILQANIHGNEVVGREMILRLIDLFDLIITKGTTWCKQNSCGGADNVTIDMVNHLITNAEVFLLPSLNPDGRHYDRRRNCNSASSTDHNTCYSGVDLNRNFPQPERGDADSGAGKAIETKNVVDKLFKIKPETYHASPVKLPHPFLSSFTYHAGWRGISMPFSDCTNNPTNTPTSGCQSNYPYFEGAFVEDPSMKSMYREYANLNNWLHGSSKGYQGLLYSYDMDKHISGSSKDWITAYQDAFDASIELTGTMHPNFNANNEGVPDQWNYNRKAMATFLYRATKGFHLEITDTLGQPVYGTRVTSGNRTVTYGGTNFIHRLAGRTINPELRGYGTPESSYLGGTPVDITSPLQVTIEKAGYKTKTVSLTPEYFNGNYTQVTLTSDTSPTLDDLRKLLSFMYQDSFPPEVDLNSDQKVNVLDFSELMLNLGL